MEYLKDSTSDLLSIVSDEDEDEECPLKGPSNRSIEYINPAVPQNEVMQMMMMMMMMMMRENREENERLERERREERREERQQAEAD